MACKHIVLIALDQTDSTALDVNYGRAIVDISKQIKAKDVSIFLPNAIAPNSTFKLFSGVIESSYEDRRYKQKLTTDIKKEPACNNTIKSLSVVGLANTADKEAVAEQGRLALAVSGGVTLARDLVGAPPNSKTPLVISAVARQLAKQHPSFSCQVLEQEECEDLNMGAFLSVQKGSKFPPQFIHMTYRSPTLSEKRAPLRVALIGKGLTFDSGGYNLKVGASSQIEMMKVDMGGLGAVMGTARAIADLQPENMEVHFISAVCENMVSENAMRPGDIVAASNGKTIEILNTDAEGRLTLADALVYADKLDVDVVIDLATLTGACVVALGQKTAAVYSDHRELMDGLMTASERTGDDLWPLPLKKGYKKNIKSKVADIKNVGSGGGGSITAALFLQEFISTSKQWAHIDMAGPVYDEELHRSTGFGVKLLTDFLLTHAKA
ncbi:LAP1 [Symbiodinium microadriaticum]|nr:LAP1 [Symbiodinium microadriaticum]